MSAAEEYAAALRQCEVTLTQDDAVTLCLFGHTIKRDGPRWTCTCGLAPRLGQGSYAHQADEVVSLLRRRGELR